MPPAVVAEALAKGPLGVPALAAVAGAVLAPLTLYRQGYSFSVGYGSAVGVMALAAMRAVPSTMVSEVMVICEQPARAVPASANAPRRIIGRIWNSLV